MQVSLYSSGLKQPTILSTPKTTTPLMLLPTPHLMKFDTKINQTSLDFILSVARPMSSYIQRTKRSYCQELLKAYSLGTLIHRRHTRSIFHQRGKSFALSTSSLM